MLALQATGEAEGTPLEGLRKDVGAAARFGVPAVFGSTFDPEVGEDGQLKSRSIKRKNPLFQLTEGLDGETEVAAATPSTKKRPSEVRAPLRNHVAPWHAPFST